MRLVAGFILGALLMAVSAWAVEQKENLANFTDPESVAVLNEQLREIRAELADHEQRLTDGGL